MKIKEKVKVVLASLAVMVAGVVGVALPVSAADAVTIVCPDGTKVTGTYENCSATAEGEHRSLFGTLQMVINIVLGVLAFITVAMIIIGGISYSTSQGDPGKVKKAKDTILYGVIGLVIALLAFAVVNFVLANIFNTTR